MQAKAARERFRGRRGFDNTLYAGTFGSENIVGLSTAAFEQLLARRYSDVVLTAERMLAMANADDLPVQVLADAHMLSGLALCNSGDDSAATAAYTEAINLDAGYGLLYLFRADTRLRLGDLAGAQADLQMAAASPQGEALAPLLAVALEGRLSCRSMLE
jgi:tetratricopeptide (TPR) repeat protein